MSATPTSSSSGRSGSYTPTSTPPLAGPASTPRTGATAGAPSNAGTLGARLLERVRRATAGRFDVIRLIGHGGMAAVYLAHDLRLDRQVALKVMLPALELSSGMSEKFLDEARRTARLSHPSIVVVHDVVELDDLIFIVMNLVNGATLEQAVPWLPTIGSADARKLNVPVVQTVLRQVASALEFAHEMGIIHRDVKPSNVMVTAKGDIVVSDFGVAKVISGAPQEKSSLLMGTPTYMSPEQCRGLSVSGASDQYSLGVMAYELLAGAPPFVGERLQVQNAHVDRDPVPLRKLRPDVSGDVARVIMKMLAKSPRDRFDSMGDVADAISVGLDANDQQPRRLLSVAASQARTAMGSLGAPTSDGSPGGEQTPSPMTLRVVAPTKIEHGQTFRVTAEMQGPDGQPATPSGLSFGSENLAVVKVEAWTGAAIAVGPGIVRLTATAGSLQGSCDVQVLAVGDGVRAPRGPRAPLPRKYVLASVGGVVTMAALFVALRFVNRTPSAESVFSPAAMAAIREASLAPNGELTAPRENATTDTNVVALDDEYRVRGGSQVVLRSAVAGPEGGIVVHLNLRTDGGVAAGRAGVFLFAGNNGGYLVQLAAGEPIRYQVTRIRDGAVQEILPATPLSMGWTDSLSIDALMANGQLRLFVNGRNSGIVINVDDVPSGGFGFSADAGVQCIVSRFYAVALSRAS